MLLGVKQKIFTAARTLRGGQAIFDTHEVTFEGCLCERVLGSPYQLRVQWLRRQALPERRRREHQSIIHELPRRGIFSEIQGGLGHEGRLPILL